MHGWPRAAFNCCAAQRACVSVGPPGGNGMMMRTGFTGYACPEPVELVCAAAGAAIRAAATMSDALAPCCMGAPLFLLSIRFYRKLLRPPEYTLPRGSHGSSTRIGAEKKI